jgi:peptide deformylase
VGKKLVRWPDPRLKEICEPVPAGMDCSEIINALLEVKEEHRGLGIAAPQIGEMLRIIVVEELIIINPVITKASDQMRWVWEGCLSFPETCPKYSQDMSIIRDGDRVRVRRHKRVKVEGFDRNWQPFSTKGSDWKGACLQHEIEHLDGVTLDDHRRR